jgi:hypothetical protein
MVSTNSSTGADHSIGAGICGRHLRLGSTCHHQRRGTRDDSATPESRRGFSTVAAVVLAATIFAVIGLANPPAGSAHNPFASARNIHRVSVTTAGKGRAAALAAAMRTLWDQHMLSSSRQTKTPPERGFLSCGAGIRTPTA